MRKLLAVIVGFIASLAIVHGAWAGAGFANGSFTKFQYQAVGPIVDLGNNEGSEQLANLVSQFEVSQVGFPFPVILSIAFTGPGSPQTIVLNDILNTPTCSQNNAMYANCNYTTQVTITSGTTIAPGTVFGAIGTLALNSPTNVITTADSSFTAVAAVSEPETLALLGIAALGAGAALRRRRR